MTARKKLVIHASGRVSGKIRYGKMLVQEGGEMSGDVGALRAEPQHVPRAHGRRRTGSRAICASFALQDLAARRGGQRRHDHHLASAACKARATEGGELAQLGGRDARARAPSSTKATNLFVAGRGFVRPRRTCDTPGARSAPPRPPPEDVEARADDQLLEASLDGGSPRRHRAARGSPVASQPPA
jgi:hypothetical protein